MANSVTKEKGPGLKAVPPIGNHTNCEKYLVKDGRYCKFAKINGGNFCHYHCPLDTNMIICEFCKVPLAFVKFQSHLRVCPIVVDSQRIRSEPFFVENCNFFCSNSCSKDLEEKGDKIAVSPFLLENKAIVLKLVQKINRAAALIPPINDSFLSSPDCENWINNNSQVLNKKHESQQAMILGHLHPANLFDKDFVYVELGAGKAGLLSMLRNVLDCSCFACIFFLFFF